MTHTIRKSAYPKLVVPVVLALLMSAVIIAALLAWSAARTNSISASRQQQLVSHALNESISELAFEQETMTRYDRAVPFFNQPGWLLEKLPEQLLKDTDLHYGLYFHKFYGHDEVYLLNGADQPIYAMFEGARVERSDYGRIAAVAAPMVSRLRRIMRKTGGVAFEEGSPGIADIARVNGHLALVGLKPIVPASRGAERFLPGKEAVMISVQRLDREFVSFVADRLLLKGARFSLTDDHHSQEKAAAFHSPLTKAVVGYLIWEPYSPGAAVLKDMILPLTAGFLVVSAVTWLLILRIRRSTAELQASEAQARHLAFHDVLTGLPNRGLFEDRLDHALAATRRGGESQVALLYLDLDRFKRINDVLGHPAGDELIREVARRLQAAVRESDTVARLGGDEFAIIQTGVRSLRDIRGLCDRILSAVAEPADLLGTKVHVEMSIGVARAPGDSLDRTELTRKADIALYQAKQQGRGRYAIFERPMDAMLRKRQMMEEELRTALKEGGQLQLCYQPKYDAETRKISGIEALLRWRHPRKGLLSPTLFVPIAEETGLIDLLGEWVLRESCASGRDWPVGSLSVNVSSAQLRNPDFPDLVLEIVRSTGFDPRRLELEITETSFIENIDQCRKGLRKLRAAGVQIALDDFGTGYSSFTHLRDLRVDRIKIDRSFTAAAGQSRVDGAIIEAIVGLAQANGLKVTAEGVETVEQSDFLRDMGCDELQGYLLSRPLTAADLEKLLMPGNEENRRMAA